MDYTQIPEWYNQIYLDKFKYGQGDRGAFSMAKARNDVVVFAYYMVGIKMRIYQAFMLDCICGKLPQVCGDDRKKFIMCLGRQVGKSTALQALSLWAAYFNRYPSGVSKDTKVFVISRSDEQAKKFLEDIRKMVRAGDMHMSQVTRSKKEHTVNWLSAKLIEPNNSTTLTFKNAYGIRSSIKSVPPTDAVIGNSADILVIDEAAKLNCNNPDNWFNEAAEPTTTATGGITILNSTPNGSSGFYYDLFDPDDHKQVHAYYRIWFPYSINTEPGYVADSAAKKERLVSDGKIKEWEQEYEAKFTTQTTAFFDSQRVDLGVDDTLGEVYSHKGPTAIGVDYGMVNSQTVFTISEGLTTLRQIAYPSGDSGLSWFADVCELVDTFHCEYIIVDDCPQGYTMNNQLIQKYGEFPAGKVRKLNFRGEKIKMYTEYRRKLYLGEVKYPHIPKLLRQMKAMQEIQNKISVSIEKGSGQRDDRVDSEVMSKFLYLDNEVVQEIGLNWDDPYAQGLPTDEELKSVRGDTQWLQIQKDNEIRLKQLGLR